MFNDIIVRHFSNPVHAADLADATHTIELGNAVCGDRIRVQLRLAADIVEKARFRAWGCATSLATGDAFCQFIEGKSMASLARLPGSDIDELLGELEPAQRHCLDLLHQLFIEVSRQEGGHE
jgi:nitrogen fixation NifU-like protein